VVLKPQPASACKGLYYKATKLTTLDCLDTGVYRLGGRGYGTAYRWRWSATTGKPAVPEDGSFSINLGNGNLFLRMKGIARPVGKVTTASGTQKTTGTWRYSGGSGAYKGRAGSGTYVFLVKRNATTYLVLAVSLRGTIR